MIRCEWKRLLTGELLCSERAAYLVFARDCHGCGEQGHSECQGAGVCEEHAALERAQNPDLIRITSLPAVAEVMAL